MVACYARHPHFSQSLLEFKEAEVIFDLVLFGTQVLDHAPHGCCSISPSHSRYSTCCSSQAVLGKHSRTTAVLRTFAFKSFRMLRFICLWQTLRCCRCPAVGKHLRSRSSHSSHLSHSRIIALVLRALSRHPVYQYIDIRLVQPSLYLRVELR